MLGSSLITVLLILILVAVLILVWLGVKYDREQQRKILERIRDEPCSDKPEFENLPNFRLVGGKALHNRYGQRVRDGLLYRSSRTDFLTQEEMNRFLQLGIKAIIDLRSSMEYTKADGDKILDRAYKLRTVKKGKIEDWKPSKHSKRDNSTYTGTRYLVNMVTKELIKVALSPIHVVFRYSIFLLFVVDRIFGTHIFLKTITHLGPKNFTLGDNYVTMLECTKPEVADVLRLLLDESNLPVLIHCAHGKDRTGVVVAAILGCLEVEDGIIVDDYARSEAGLGPMRRRLFKEMYGLNEKFTRATPDAMRQVLAGIAKKYGSMSGYLSSAGFTVDEQQALKRVFLENE